MPHSVRFLIKKLTPRQNPLLSTRWVLVTFDPHSWQEPSLHIQGYHFTHAECVEHMDSLVRKEARNGKR